jgi:AbrB family looped-hinge helix DNA binding protein
MMRITTKGQVTIPIEVRERTGLLPHTDVRFTVVDGKAYIEKIESSSRVDVIARMKGKATVKMTTDEIMRLTRG